MKTKFKGFEVTDFAALKAAFPKVVETVEVVKSADVRKLLELGVAVPGVTVTGEDKPEPLAPQPEEVAAVSKEGNASVEQVMPAFMNKGKKGE